MKLRIRVDLDEFEIVQLNESKDEPYLWPVYIVVDGSAINLADPRRSTLKIHMPPGSHGDLGSNSEDMAKGAKRPIPAAIGQFEAELDTGLFDLARGAAADAAMVAVGIMAFEEDNTWDSTAEDARRAAFHKLRDELNRAFGALMAQALGGGNLSAAQAEQRLRDIDIGAVVQAAVAEVMDQVLPGVIAGLLVNPLFFAIAADQDDYVGLTYQRATLRQLVQAGPEGMTFSRTINGQGEGTYRVRGRIRALDVQALPSVALTYGAGDRLDLFVRGGDRRFHRARRLAGGGFGGYAPIGAGVFTAGPAATCSESNQLMRAFGRGNDSHLWQAASADGGNSWHLAWGQIDDFGVFTSAPAACASNDGRSICLAARGNDKRAWHAVSTDAGASWQRAWTPIGEGVFDSALALACSADGRRIYAVGRGLDRRVWLAVSGDFGAGWVGWSPIGAGQFKSAPAVACSADGRTVHVVGLGLDDRLWYARSRDGAASWEVAWTALQPASVFIGSPAAACSADGSRLALAAIGFDLRVWWSLMGQAGNSVEVGFTPVAQPLYAI